MKFFKIIACVSLIIGTNAFAESSFKFFAEPYIEKSFIGSAQKIDNVPSQTGDASTFSIGSKLGLESSFGLLGGVGMDHTSVIVTNEIPSNAGYDMSFQSFDVFVGYKFLDYFRITYGRSIAGKVSTNDGANRKVDFTSNKISLGVLVANKAYLEISRIEKDSELESANAAVASRAEVFDTYTIGLSYPIELF